jgi:hypothetical protein
MQGVCTSTAFMEDVDGGVPSNPCGAQAEIAVSCGGRMRVCCPLPDTTKAAASRLPVTKMPNAVLAVLNDTTHSGDMHAMGDHHLAWHMARQWGRLQQSDFDWLATLGIKKPASHQEGAAQNGLEFLAMHRAVLTMLRTYPGFTADNIKLFDGWQRVPDPSDPLVQKLPNTDPGSLAQNHLSPGEEFDIPEDLRNTIKACQDEPADDTCSLARFESDDEFGRFIETSVNKGSLGDLMNLGAGGHNYLHNRFSQPGTSNDLGDPQKNFKNQIFWRLHGWIDRCWTKFRHLKRFDDTTDTAYIAALARGRTEMHIPMPQAQSQQ